MNRKLPRFYFADVSSIITNTHMRNPARIPQPLEDQVEYRPTWDFDRNKYRPDASFRVASRNHPLRDLALEEARRGYALRQVFVKLKAKGRSTSAIEEQMNSAMANKVRYDAAAADAIFRKLNQDMLAYEYDLHGLYAAEAAARAHKVLDEAISAGDPVAIFIIGHESHRGTGESVSTKVEALIQKLGLEYYNSDARFTVHLPKKGEPREASLNKLRESSTPQALAPSRGPSPTRHIPSASASGLKTEPAQSTSASKARIPRSSEPSNSYKPQTPRSRRT